MVNSILVFCLKLSLFWLCTAEKNAAISYRQVLISVFYLLWVSLFGFFWFCLLLIVFLVWFCWCFFLLLLNFSAL